MSVLPRRKIRFLWTGQATRVVIQNIGVMSGTRSTNIELWDFWNQIATACAQPITSPSTNCQGGVRAICDSDSACVLLGGAAICRIPYSSTILAMCFSLSLFHSSANLLIRTVENQKYSNCSVIQCRKKKRIQKCSRWNLNALRNPFAEQFELHNEILVFSRGNYGNASSQKSSVFLSVAFFAAYSPARRSWTGTWWDWWRKAVRRSDWNWRRSRQARASSRPHRCTATWCRSLPGIASGTPGTESCRRPRIHPSPTSHLNNSYRCCPFHTRSQTTSVSARRYLLRQPEITRFICSFSYQFYYFHNSKLNLKTKLNIKSNNSDLKN